MAGAVGHDDRVQAIGRQRARADALVAVAQGREDLLGTVEEQARLARRTLVGREDQVIGGHAGRAGVPDLGAHAGRVHAAQTVVEEQGAGVARIDADLARVDAGRAVEARDADRQVTDAVAGDVVHAADGGAEADLRARDVLQDEAVRARTDAHRLIEGHQEGLVRDPVAVHVADVGRGAVVVPAGDEEVLAPELLLRRSVHEDDVVSVEAERDPHQEIGRSVASHVVRSVDTGAHVVEVAVAAVGAHGPVEHGAVEPREDREIADRVEVDVVLGGCGEDVVVAVAVQVADPAHVGPELEPLVPLHLGLEGVDQKAAHAGEDVDRAVVLRSRQVDARRADGEVLAVVAVDVADAIDRGPEAIPGLVADPLVQLGAGRVREGVDAPVVLTEAGRGDRVVGQAVGVEVVESDDHIAQAVTGVLAQVRPQNAAVGAGEHERAARVDAGAVVIGKACEQLEDAVAVHVGDDVEVLTEPGAGCVAIPGGLSCCGGREDREREQGEARGHGGSPCEESASSRPATATGASARLSIAGLPSSVRRSTSPGNE